MQLNPQPYSVPQVLANLKEMARTHDLEWIGQVSNDIVQRGIATDSALSPKPIDAVKPLLDLIEGTRKSKHTATPWYVVAGTLVCAKENDATSFLTITPEEGQTDGRIGFDETRANAEYIVRACNSFGALLDSCNYLESVAPIGTVFDEEFVTITITGKGLKDLRAAIGGAK